mmetsp:Transcript_2001/g.3742  ORF Transcript_2001/g.3742 Transcript_2001/m.3742 type:complete len:252 (-) Transcript_2001:222-977(-)|eukprot:CAMPEP_0197648318 /NCGR_PEP_ID=MMETSP1338-20131121/27683_1 /TAXON_ID=43686 ORGANISM="Pelagodinium beii, Strain RCC1491" /NCGR_SAMPLE_ID=MMETSP1338 /ASSEMBLY_ACC=CAM_ASM_000754 /LENGTH=251 /DNA_ID=CAMNT_0043222295 /DNA_START=92 /DNA_END=847 /DNA_ORIENTATION=+
MAGRSLISLFLVLVVNVSAMNFSNTSFEDVLVEDTTSTTTTTTTPEHKKITIQGEATLTVGDADAFVNDPTAKVGVQKAIASTVGVEAEEVSVILSVVTSSGGIGDSRRLEARKLAAKSVKVEYTIETTAAAHEVSAKGAELSETLAAIDTAVLADAIKSAIEAEGGDTYSVAVVSFNSEAPVIEGEEPTPPSDGDDGSGETSSDGDAGSGDAGSTSTEYDSSKEDAGEGSSNRRSKACILGVGLLLAQFA